MRTKQLTNQPTSETEGEVVHVKVIEKAMNRNWSNQKANPAL